ncbi:MAG TPA: hypothetical protein VGM90_19475 [Kofleriaceae bacterium]|jgi:hypothetical protein
MRAVLIALLLVGCTKATPTEAPTTGSDKAGYAPPPPKPNVAAKITLSAVSFGDDCGGTAPTNAPAHVAPAGAVAPPATMAAPSERPGAVATQQPQDRRCEQTSMQLVVTATSDSVVEVKSITVVDDTGKDLGTLTPSKPTRWSTTSSTYEAWDQKVAAGQTAQVSYVLSQPEFINRWQYANKTYTVKVVAAVGGVEQALQSTVLIVAAPPPVPT